MEKDFFKNNNSSVGLGFLYFSMHYFTVKILWVSSNYSQNELPIEYLTCRNLEHPKRPQFYNRQRYHDNYRPQYRPREAFQNIYPQVLPHPSGMPRMSRYAERYPRGPEYLNYPPSDYSHSPTGIWIQNYIFSSENQTISWLEGRKTWNDLLHHHSFSQGVYPRTYWPTTTPQWSRCQTFYWDSRFWPLEFFGIYLPQEKH